MAGSLTKIRNIGIIAHIDAGKTTATEAMLYYSGRSHRIGSIDEGTTVMDYLDEERARGITITAAAATFPWKDSLIHLIDTPGHIDFTAEVERSLRVIDGAVVIFSAVEGVEAQSEKVWHQADRYHVPKIAFINKLDRIGASFSRVFDEINRKFEDCAVALQAPVGLEADFSRVIDLVGEKLLVFDNDSESPLQAYPLPEELVTTTREKREAMLERLADHSEEIALLYLEGEEVPEELIHKEICRLTLGNVIVPVLLGTAKNRIGIQPLMNAVLDYLPSPEDVGEIRTRHLKTGKEVTVSPDAGEPFAGLIFKLTAGTSADLLYIRTYSGELKAGATYINTRTGNKVRIKQILRLYAKSTEALDRVGPGDIVGVIGPRECGTGDTICAPQRQLAFESITFPEPVVSMAVEPRFTKDKDKLDNALQLLVREDPTLASSRDEETAQRILSGMGELHLEINLKRLNAEFNVEARAGEPRVAYRETFADSGTIESVFERVMGETELYAEAEVRFRPLSGGEESFSVKNECRDVKQIPKTLRDRAETTLYQGLRTGGIHGYPLIYVEAVITRLGIHPERTTEGAIAGAVLTAVDKAIHQIRTRVLEPLMHLEIITPEDTVGEISTYLQPRRAVIHKMETVGAGKRIACEVPLAEMFGFGKALPKLSGGRASFSMEPCGYQELPEDAAAKMFGTL